MRPFALFLALGILSSAVCGATVEYKGAGGDLGVAPNWYVITNINDPTSTTGATQLPAIGDTAVLRNGTTTTLNSAIGAQKLHVGGPVITGQATGPHTTMYIANGASLTMPSDIPEGTGPLFSIGGTYPATVNMTGGSVSMITRQPAVMDVSGPSGGTFNMSGGSLYIGHGSLAFGVPTLRVGSGAGNLGAATLSGGTIKLSALAGSPDRYMRVGSDSGTGQFTMSNGVLLNNGSLEMGSEGPAAAPPVGLFVQTGGSHYVDYRLTVGWGEGQAHYKLLGGTLNMNAPVKGEFLLGRDAPTSTAGRGKLTVHQSAVIKTGSFFMGGWTGGGTPATTQLEVKLNSMDSSAIINNLRHADMNGRLEISLVDGFRPAAGSSWLLISAGGNIGNWFSDMTTGFRTEYRESPVRGIYLVCDGPMQAGDANNDGFVDVGDLGILAFNWGQTDMWGKSWTEADFTGDDVVDVGDLGVLAFNWGWSGAPAGSGAPVPEPMSLTLLGLGGLALVRRRR